LYFFTSCCWVWGVIAQIRSINNIYISHIIILTFISINWVIVVYNFSYWFTLPLSVFTSSSISLLSVYQTFMLFDAKILESVLTGYTMTEKRTENWISFSEANVNIESTLELGTTHVILWNWYLLGETYLSMLIYVELPYVSYLSVIFMFGILCSLSTFLKFQVRS